MLRQACLPARMVRVHANAEELAHASKFVAVYVVSTRASVRFNAEELYVPPATLVWRHVTKAATAPVTRLCTHTLTSLHYGNTNLVDDLMGCLLYTSDAADERSSVDLGGRRIIKKKNTAVQQQQLDSDK